MARKMYIEVTTRLIINADDDKTLSDIMNEMDYEFNSGEGYEVIDTEMTNFEVIDSK